MLEIVSEWFASLGASAATADVVAVLAVFMLIVALSLLADFVTRRLVLRGAAALITRTSTTWDDKVLRHNVLGRIARLAPALVFYTLVPLAFEGHDGLVSLVMTAIELYVIVVVVLAFDALLSAATDIYQTFEVATRVPIKGFVQVARLLLYFVGGLILLSVVLDKTPLILLSGLGAFTAVLMIIFRDAILGFVAGIQLTANQMVAIGDWIEMPKYQADGDVIEVSLTTVKVQNFDKTITTIPTYALISESFKNWRGMSDAKGRRIKRAVNIDLNSIKFCTPEMLSRFEEIEFISAYMQQKKEELAEYNAQLPDSTDQMVNGRHLTNVGTFRAYVLAYLQNSPNVRKDMTLLVRQLAPTEAGLPIEVYVFSNDTRWPVYESIQADIFDHILAVAPAFDLRVFQNPSGNEFRVQGS